MCVREGTPRGRGHAGFAGRGGAHRGQRRPVPWQLRRASADGSYRTERPPRAPAGHHRAERRPRGAAPSGGGVCQCRLGLLGRRSARRGDSGPGTRLRPRSQPARSSRQAGSSAPATRRLPGCTQRIGTVQRLVHRVVVPRVPCAPAERQGRMARYGHGSGTANGPIGRRSPGQPVAVTSPTWLRAAGQYRCRCARRSGTTRWGPPRDPMGAARSAPELPRAVPSQSRSRARATPPAGMRPRGERKSWCFPVRCILLC